MSEPPVAQGEPAPFAVPERWIPENLARCRGCDAVVMWCTTHRGKRAPIDRDGTNHFATCPDAARFRRRR